MNEDQTTTAAASLQAAYDGTMDFPTIVGSLMGAGFESYAVDYRRGTAVYFLPSGDSCQFELPADDGPVSLQFATDAIKEAIREAQTGSADYSYKAFCRKVKEAGCAGYIVSFPGRRVVYYGRTAETHVELFPNR